MKLEVKDLVKTFSDGKKGLDGISFCLETPSFVLVTGKNGSGKSLLMRHILGLEKPDSGHIFLNNKPINKNLRDLRRRIALVFQEPEHQILGLTVLEDIEFGPRADGLPKAQFAEKVKTAIQITGLAGLEARLCADLSGGEKRRLAIASALVAEPEMIILDEPFNDLDWDGTSTLLEVLLKLHAQGLAVLIVSHDLEKCLAHAERLIVMDAGKIIRDASPEQLWGELPGLGLRRLSGGTELLKNMTWLKE